MFMSLLMAEKLMLDSLDIFLGHLASSSGSQMFLTYSSVWRLLYSALYYSWLFLNPYLIFRIL